MKGHVARKRDRYYAVIYEGLDPVTGRERRSWHPAGTDRDEAEKLTARLAAAATDRDDATRSLSFGAYLTTQWLPAKKLELAATTYHGYERNTVLHVLPALGKIGLRRLRPDHIDRLYDQKLNPGDGHRALAPKTVYEIHLVIRGALTDAVRRGLVHRNVALLARSPLRRSFPPVEKTAWTVDELRAFLGAAAGHRLFPALWLSASTGMRRSELLGLRWHDLNTKRARLSINRGLVSVGYELRESRARAETPPARRRSLLEGRARRCASRRCSPGSPQGGGRSCAGVGLAIPRRTGCGTGQGWATSGSRGRHPGRSLRPG